MVEFQRRGRFYRKSYRILTEINWGGAHHKVGDKVDFHHLTPSLFSSEHICADTCIPLAKKLILNDSRAKDVTCPGQLSELNFCSEGKCPEVRRNKDLYGLAPHNYDPYYLVQSDCLDSPMFLTLCLWPLLLAHPTPIH